MPLSNSGAILQEFGVKELQESHLHNTLFF